MGRNTMIGRMSRIELYNIKSSAFFLETRKMTAAKTATNAVKVMINILLPFPVFRSQAYQRICHNKYKRIEVMNQTRYNPIGKFKSGLVRNPIPGRNMASAMGNMVFIFDLNCFYFLIYSFVKLFLYCQMIIKLLKNLYLLQSLDSANIRQLVL
jgi:hypothetical protein